MTATAKQERKPRTAGDPVVSCLTASMETAGLAMLAAQPSTLANVERLGERAADAALVRQRYGSSVVDDVASEAVRHACFALAAGDDLSDSATLRTITRAALRVATRAADTARGNIASGTPAAPDALPVRTWRDWQDAAKVKRANVYTAGSITTVDAAEAVLAAREIYAWAAPFRSGPTSRLATVALPDYAAYRVDVADDGSLLADIEPPVRTWDYAPASTDDASCPRMADDYRGKGKCSCVARDDRGRLTFVAPTVIAGGQAIRGVSLAADPTAAMSMDSQRHAAPSAESAYWRTVRGAAVGAAVRQVFGDAMTAALLAAYRPERFARRDSANRKRGTITRAAGIGWQAAAAKLGATHREMVRRSARLAVPLAWEHAASIELALTLPTAYALARGLPTARLPLPTPTRSTARSTRTTEVLRPTLYENPRPWNPDADALRSGLSFPAVAWHGGATLPLPYADDWRPDAAAAAAGVKRAAKRAAAYAAEVAMLAADSRRIRVDRGMAAVSSVPRPTASPAGTGYGVIPGTSGD